MHMIPNCNSCEIGKVQFNTPEFPFTDYGSNGVTLDTDKGTSCKQFTNTEPDYPRPKKRKNPYTVVNLFGCTVKSIDPYCLYLEYSNLPRISPIHEFYRGIPVKEETTLLDNSNAISRRGFQKQEEHKMDMVVGNYKVGYKVVPVVISNVN